MGNYYGLLVGVGDYENIAKLYKTNKDAKDLYKALIAAGYPEQNLRLLLDKDATVNKISSGLDWLARVAYDEQDTVVIFFSGHGVRFEGGLWSGEFLCPVETNINQRDPRSTLIASEDFSKALRRIRSGRMAVLLDACHAGGIGEVKDALIDARAGLSEDTYSKLAMSKGRVIIASSKTDEPSYELKEMENGLFTHYLLEGLQGKAALPNGVISITSLFSHVYHRVSEIKSQHPFMKFDGEDFAIARLSDNAMSDSPPEKADGSKVKGSFIDIADEHFTYEQAESILANLYHKFHGRDVDDTAKSDWLPFLQEHGFSGLGVVFDMIANSDERRQVEKPEFDRLFQKHFERLPSDEEWIEFGKAVRFLPGKGRDVIARRMSTQRELHAETWKLIDSKKNKDAQVVIERSFKDGVPYAQAWHDLGVSLYRQGEYKSAINAYHHAIALNPTNDSSFLSSCDDLRMCYVKVAEQGDTNYLQVGFEDFESLTRLKGDRWSVWHEAALMAPKPEKLELAISMYKKAIDLNETKNYPWSHDDLKWCFDKLMKSNSNAYQMGFDYFLALTQSHPNSWPAWHQCGWFAWKLGKKKEAIEHYKKAIQIIPKGEWAWSATDLVQLFFDAGAGEQGYQYFSESVNEKNDFWEIWYALGSTQLYIKKEINEAINSFKKSIELHPSDNGWYWSWNMLGDCFRTINNQKEAKEAYLKSISIEKDNEHAKKKLEEIGSI